MLQLPPIPDWNRLHPLVVHFPVALLLIAPLFVIVGGLLAPAKGRAFLNSALILMAIGTVALFVAVESGESASEAIAETAAVRDVLSQHEKFAEMTCLIFSILTVVFVHLLLLPKLLKRELSRSLNASLLAAFLILYGTGALFLVNTAHQGGLLVHEFGVLSGSQNQAAAAPSSSGEIGRSAPD